MEPHEKTNLLTNCNSFDLGVLFSLVESGSITIDEFNNADLESEKLNELIIQFSNTLSVEELIEYIESGEFNFEDFEEAELESNKLIALQLHFCNTLDIDTLLKLVQSNTISLDKFIDSGLKDKTVDTISKIINTPTPGNIKLEMINQVKEGIVSAFDIRVNINNSKYTFDD